MTTETLPALEPKVRALMASARREVVVIAPFIKAPVMGRILREIVPTAQLLVVTRWRLDEIVGGVSDLEVWPQVRDSGGELLLLDNLHAKLFISDSTALIGSANLTRAAMSGPAFGNLELLAEVRVDHPSVVEVRSYVERHAQAATDELYHLLSSAASETVHCESSIDDWWFPRFRHPHDMLRAADGSGPYTASEIGLARRDLKGLGLPPDGQGVSPTLLARVLMLQPVVKALADFVDVEQGRRFGELRAWLRDSTTDEDADIQTLIRWVLHYLPDYFTYRRPRHSEILARGRAEWPSGRTAGHG